MMKHIVLFRRDDERGLEQYLKHPKHLDLVADLKEYFEWAAVDYTG